MDQTTLLRACALYEFDQGQSAAKAARNIRSTYGSDDISDSNYRKWFREVYRGLQDLPSEGRPQILDPQALKAAVDANPYLTLKRPASF